MSRRAAVVAIGLLLAVPAHAQEQSETSAAEALRAAEATYGPPTPKECAKVGEGEEIVVCAEEQEQSQFRYSDNEEAEDRYARATMDKGAPRAPDVGGPGIFKGPATVGNLCIPGLQNCPPPPAYFVDFSQLPEAPPGSDADRIGRGLAPRGDDFGPGLPPVPDSPEPVTLPESASPVEQP